MNPVLIAFVAIVLVPLFVASWRTSLFGLAIQGLLLGWISYQLDPGLSSVASWVRIFDLVMIRGIALPIALYAVLRSQRVSARNDVIPPNLMSWTLAVGLVFVGFRFADILEPGLSTDHDFVAGATAALLLGFLVLATQTGPFSQMVGVLRIENAIALFELGGHEPLEIQLARTALLIVTGLLFRWYLRTLPRSGKLKVSVVEGGEG